MADEIQVPSKRMRLPLLTYGDIVMMAHGVAMMAWLFTVVLTWSDESGDPMPSLGLVFGVWLVTVPVAWLVARLLERPRTARSAVPIQVEPAAHA